MATDIFNMADTWNNGATTFSAIKMNVTDTASASGSLLLDLQVGGVAKFQIVKSGDIQTWNAGSAIQTISQGSTVNLYGARSGTYRWMMGQDGFYCQSGGGIGWSSAAADIGSNGNNPSNIDTKLVRSAAGIVRPEGASAAGGAFEFTNRTAPSAPAASKVRLYAQDNGSGKGQLMVLFPTGVAQQVAIEP